MYLEFFAADAVVDIRTLFRAFFLQRDGLSEGAAEVNLQLANPPASEPSELAVPLDAPSDIRAAALED